jgi:chromate transporter
LTESEIIWVFVLSGVVAIVVRTRPRPSGPMLVVPWVWWSTGLAGVASTATLWKLGLYFAQAGALVFGSGLAIVPFLHGGVVERFHWLTERQFLDAVAVAMITPGPVVITVAFIGYLVAGPLGATASAIGVFLPCYLTVIIPAPYFRRFSGNAKVKAFVDGVSAAATGAIGGAAVVLGRRAIVDVPTVAFCLGTLLVLTLSRRVPEPIVILVAGVIGLAIKGMG